MRYLLLRKNDTTQLAIGPLKQIEIKPGMLQIELQETTTAWQTVTGWFPWCQYLAAKVTEQQVLVGQETFEVGAVVTMSDYQANNINKTFLLRNAPRQNIMQYIFDMPPTEFEALSLLSGV